MCERPALWLHERQHPVHKYTNNTVVILSRNITFSYCFVSVRVQKTRKVKQRPHRCQQQTNCPESSTVNSFNTQRVSHMLRSHKYTLHVFNSLRWSPEMLKMNIPHTVDKVKIPLFSCICCFCCLLAKCQFSGQQQFSCHSFLVLVDSATKKFEAVKTFRPGATFIQAAAQPVGRAPEEDVTVFVLKSPRAREGVMTP